MLSVVTDIICIHLPYTTVERMKRLNIFDFINDGNGRLLVHSSTPFTIDSHLPWHKQTQYVSLTMRN